MKNMRFIGTSWIFWSGLVSLGAVWVIPSFPDYQDWMPYGYDLGGIALVLLYLLLGFGSLGFYSLFFARMPRMSVQKERGFLLKIGLGSLFLTLGCLWGYFQLMQLTLSVQ